MGDFMRVITSKSKNTESFYISKGYVTEMTFCSQMLILLT